MHKYVDANPQLRESVNWLKTTKMTELGTPIGMMAALHAVFRKRDKKTADKFMTELAEGENLSKTNPTYKLRQLFIGRKSSTRKQWGEALLILVIKTWNAVRSKKELKQLKVALEESRPKIL